MGSAASARVLVVGLSGLFGLLIGSFLNVVIYRLPRGISIVRPPSQCPNCGTEIRSLDNIPLVSWLALRGRCRTCRSPISARYPLVELTTGLVFLSLAWALGSEDPLVGFLVIAGAVIASVGIDFDRLAIPWSLAITAFLGALALGVAAVLTHQPGRIGWAALGAVLVALALAAVDERTGTAPRGAKWLRRAAVGASLGWSAGWVWALGGPILAIAALVAGLAVRLASRWRPARPVVLLVAATATLALVLAGSVVNT